MAKIRVKKERAFSVIPNEILRDKRLTPKARFMLIFCLSLADEWEYNIRGLATVMGCGVDAVTTGLKELEECNYLKREQKHVKGGRFGGNDYILYERPYQEPPCTEKPCTVKPNTVEPCTEKPRQYNTNQYNTKEIKNKRNNTKKAFIPPTLEEIEAYIQENNFNVDANKFFRFYSSCDWKDSNNRLVKNWKNKLRQVWNKEEPTKPTPKPISQEEQAAIDRSLSMTFDEETEMFNKLYGIGEEKC